MMTQSNNGLQLKFLKGDNCPICGTHVVIEESVDIDRYGKNPKVREHVHGGNWEHRKFICGTVLSYIPNFSRTEINERFSCKYDPVLIEQNKKRELMKEAVLTFINQQSDVDDIFKTRIVESVKRTYIE